MSSAELLQGAGFGGPEEVDDFLGSRTLGPLLLVVMRSASAPATIFNRFAARQTRARSRSGLVQTVVGVIQGGCGSSHLLVEPQLLDTELLKSTDADHRNLIHRRRRALGV